MKLDYVPTKYILADSPTRDYGGSSRLDMMSERYWGDGYDTRKYVISELNAQHFRLLQIRDMAIAIIEGRKKLNKKNVREIFEEANEPFEGENESWEEDDEWSSLSKAEREELCGKVRQENINA